MLNCTDLECILHHHHYYAHLHHLKHGTHVEEGGKYRLGQIKSLIVRVLHLEQKVNRLRFPYLIDTFASDLVATEGSRTELIILDKTQISPLVSFDVRRITKFCRSNYFLKNLLLFLHHYLLASIYIWQ
jgi:hypothetical protein